MYNFMDKRIERIRTKLLNACGERFLVPQSIFLTEKPKLQLLYLQPTSQNAPCSKS